MTRKKTQIESGHQSTIKRETDIDAKNGAIYGDRN